MNEYITKEQAKALVEEYEGLIGKMGVRLICKGIDDLAVTNARWEPIGPDENDIPRYRCTNCQAKRYGRSRFCSGCGAEMGK